MESLRERSHLIIPGEKKRHFVQLKPIDEGGGLKLMGCFCKIMHYWSALLGFKDLKYKEATVN